MSSCLRKGKYIWQYFYPTALGLATSPDYKSDGFKN